MIPAFFFVLGAIIGSFVGVVSERIYTGQSWVAGRSRCDACGRELSLVDLIPIVSWVIALGRCRACGARISVSSFIVEVLLGALFALFAASLGVGWMLGCVLVFLSVLALIVVYDLRHTIVPPIASTLLVVTGVVYLFLSSASLVEVGKGLLWAGGIGMCFLLLFVLSRGRAMGLGDAPVAFALALIATPYAFSGLLFSFWSGAIVGIVLLAVRHRGSTMNTEVPFVPFLAFGFLLAYFIQWNPLYLPLL